MSVKLFVFLTSSNLLIVWCTFSSNDPSSLLQPPIVFWAVHFLWEFNDLAWKVNRLICIHCSAFYWFYLWYYNEANGGKYQTDVKLIKIVHFFYQYEESLLVVKYFFSENSGLRFASIPHWDQKQNSNINKNQPCLIERL